LARTLAHYEGTPLERKNRAQQPHKKPEAKIAAILPADTMLELYSGPYLNHNGSTD
jgi:hypothetical protein